MTLTTQDDLEGNSIVEFECKQLQPEQDKIRD